MPTSLITGVGGQDGVYLARELLAHGHRVVGTVRPGTVDRPAHAVYLAGAELLEHDLLDPAGFDALLERVRPDHVYHLAGLTAVGLSWAEPQLTLQTNTTAVRRLLEALVRHRDRHGIAPRLFHASTSAVFDDAGGRAQDEHTPHRPASPYAASKDLAHRLVATYRETQGLFAATGICFNHESPLRGEQFVTRKIARGAAEIALGRRDRLGLGTLDVRRDWGHAVDHVRAMRLSLEAPEPADRVLATGRSTSLADLLHTAFARAGVEHPMRLVDLDPALQRPTDVADLVGDPTRARIDLNWRAEQDAATTVSHMVDVDLRRLRTGVEHDPAYLIPEIGV